MAKNQKIGVLESYDEVNDRLRELAALESRLQAAESQMNEKIQKVKDEFNEITTDDRARKAEIERELETFVKMNKKDFEKERTKHLFYGSISMRWSTPKVHQLNRKYTVKTSLELLKQVFKKRYIRTKEEINKDKIIEDYNAQHITDDKLAAVGLKIDQAEKMSYKINWDVIKEAV